MPIIILHGLFGMSDNWLSISKRLAVGYEVFMIDLRNHGQSAHSLVFNYDVMKDDLLEFINTNALQSPVIIGHSMGGKVAMHFALNYGELVSKLIIVDISSKAYSIFNEHVDLINVMLSVDFKNIKTYSEIDLQLKNFPITDRIRQFLLKNIYRNENNEFNWKFGLEEIKMNLDILLKSVANGKHFSKPTLFIKGGLSKYLLKSDYSLISEIFTDSEIISIPTAGHWVHADAPDSFVKIVQQFLRK